MNCRIFTIRFSSKNERFDDEELVQFLTDKDAIEIRDHFFMRDGTPYLAMVVLYNGISSASENEPKSKTEKEKTDYKELLSEEDWAVFKRLREWRNDKAKAEGIPPYILFTNRQLALIASKRPDNKTALGSIEGVGEAKIEKSGEEILSMIRGLEAKPAKEGEAPAKPGVKQKPEIENQHASNTK